MVTVKVRKQSGTTVEFLIEGVPFPFSSPLHKRDIIAKLVSVGCRSFTFDEVRKPFAISARLDVVKGTEEIWEVNLARALEAVVAKCIATADQARLAA